MGKCKKRTLNKSVMPAILTREDAVCSIIQNLRDEKFDTKTKKLLSLFGITPEELTEAGATYEEVLVIKRFM